MRKMSRILHFLRTHGVFGEVRVVTNGGTDAEKAAADQSSDSNDVAKMAGNNSLFSLNSGNWFFRLLQHRAADKGLQFRLNVVENGCINPHPLASESKWAEFRANWKAAVDKSTFAWATAASSFFLQIEGQEEWGLKPLGIELVDAPKSAKRANEIPRIAEMFLYTEDIKSVRVKVRTPMGVSPADRDGMNYVSQSFALRMVAGIGDPARRAFLTQEIESGRLQLLGTFRVPFGPGFIPGRDMGGLIKGHAIIRPDKVMKGYDIITVPENIKDELRATGSFILATAEVKHVTYQATWDVQRMVMNPLVLTHEHRQRDLGNLIGSIKESIEEGKVPDWLLVESAAEFEDGESVREEFGDIDSIPYRWQKAGMDIRTAQNAVRMAMGATGQRMAKYFEGGYYNGVASGYAPRMWLPKSNAFVAYFISHGSLTKVGNFGTRRDGKKAYMVRGIGLVLPSDRIEKILALMGGADFDDAAEANLVKVWSSSEKATAMMRDAGVIGQYDSIPGTKEDATYVAFLLRSPNGIGEYATVFMENILKAPWQNLDLDNVEVIDLADLPTPATVLAQRTGGAGLTSSLSYSRAPMTRSDALRQIMAQQFNPGIGAAANALMAWAASGGKDMPPSLKVGFEHLVDGVQQLSDPAIFGQVSLIGHAISGNALGMLRTGGKVDEYLVRRFASDDREEAAAHSYEGPMTVFQEKYREAIKELYDEVEMKSLQMRHVQPIVQVVRELRFSDAANAAAREFVKKYNGKLQAVDRKYPKDKIGVGLKRVTLLKAKYAEMRSVVDAAIAELEAYGPQAPKRAVCLWRYILRPEGRNVYGHGDRLMFQPGTDRALMDILIEGLREYGLIGQDQPQLSEPQNDTWGDEEDEDAMFLASLGEMD